MVLTLQCGFTNSLDARVPHAVSIAHAPPLQSERHTSVASNALRIYKEVGLNLLKHFLLGVKLGVWLA